MKLQPAQQVNSIERVNGHRVYHVRANREAKHGASTSAQKSRRSRPGSARRPFPATCASNFKGADEEQNESGAFLVEAAFMALFLIAIVLLGAVQQFLSREPHSGGGRARHDRRAARHGGDGAALLDHHDGHRHAGAGRHRGEPQHRADRHVPSLARFRHGPDRGSDPIERATSAARCS